MEMNSQLLVNLLSKTIRNQSPDIIVDKTINWNVIYEEALAHQVHSLVFPILSQLPPEDGPEQPLLSTWQRETMIVASTQLQHIQQISKVLHHFNEENIPVVALKGLILRNYYPSPDLRTMGDADLLIHKEDMIRTKKLLKSIGYRIGETSDRHISFFYMNFPIIELHWVLSDKECSEDSAYFTNNAWNYAVETQIFGVPVLTLSIDDQILHLLFHAVHHILSTGFGLRQLCDLVLLIEAHEQTIDWQCIIDKVHMHHIHKFASTLLTVCNKLFDLKIPCTLYDSTNNSYIDLLINDILNAGVYGRRSHVRDASGRINKYINMNESPRKLTSLHSLLLFLFPPVKKLGFKYNYAKKFPLLLPIAWVHHVIHNIKRVDTLLLSKNKDIEVTSKERTKLLHWLQLR